MGRVTRAEISRPSSAVISGKSNAYRIVLSFPGHVRSGLAGKKGVALETVSVLLGDQSTKITQKHYSPWVKTRQEALEREVFRAIFAWRQVQLEHNSFWTIRK